MALGGEGESVLDDELYGLTLFPGTGAMADGAAAEIDCVDTGAACLSKP